MRVLVVGKCDVSYLVESTTDGFVENGHIAEYFDTKAYRRIDKYFYSKYTQSTLARKLKTFKPDLVFVIAPVFLDLALFDAIDSYKSSSKCLVAGWIGDIFKLSENQNEEKLGLLNLIFITDSGFDTLLGGKFESMYLPLATNPKIFKYSNHHPIKQPIFVGSMTDYRQDLLSQLQTKIKIVGNGWDNSKLSQHEVISRQCDIFTTAKLYQQHTIAINIKNEHNIINGLNQRSFDPIACGCVMVHDYVADLDRNFDIGKDLFVYSDIDRLHSILSELIETKTESSNGLGGYFFTDRAKQILCAMD